MAWLAFFNFYLVVKVFNTLDYQGFNFKVSKMNQVWVTGDAVVDLIPESETSLLKCPGGAPANVAVAIARLSGKSAFFLDV